VGFGIHQAEHVKSLAEIADGAIVGSAVVRRMQQHASEGPAAVARVIGQYCTELLSLSR
jgi:tryptophan synthase alpha chain